VTANGKRRPPRPSLEVVAPGASPAEAAAIAAALEQFLYDTAPTVSTKPPALGGWERTALAEGIGLETPDPWGDPLNWG
jgi:hypothetical protein